MKIEDLVQEFYNIEDRTFVNTQETVMSYDMAKQCAILVVNKFMNADPEKIKEIESL